MSRKKQNLVREDLIDSIRCLKKNQCSNSNQDLVYLNEGLEKLESLKKKKGLTDKQFMKAYAEVVESLLKYLLNESDD